MDKQTTSFTAFHLTVIQFIVLEVIFESSCWGDVGDPSMKPHAQKVTAVWYLLPRGPHRQSQNVSVRKQAGFAPVTSQGS